MVLPDFGEVGAVAAMWTVAVVTPGPNFLAAARISTLRDRRAGLAAVGGIGLGTMLWGFAGAFGVHLMFSLAPWLYRGADAGGRVIPHLHGPADHRREFWHGDGAPGRPCSGRRSGSGC